MYIACIYNVMYITCIYNVMYITLAEANPDEF